MKIIIVGCGKVGYTLVEQLSGENHDITVIDERAEKVNSITEELDAMGDKVIYAMAEEEMTDENGNIIPAVRWPAAIEVSDLPFFQTHAPQNDKIYLVLSGNQPNLDAVRAFWDHIHQWEKAE